MPNPWGVDCTEMRDGDPWVIQWVVTVHPQSEFRVMTSTSLIKQYMYGCEERRRGYTYRRTRSRLRQRCGQHLNGTIILSAILGKVPLIPLFLVLQLVINITFVRPFGTRLTVIECNIRWSCTPTASAVRLVRQNYSSCFDSRIRNERTGWRNDFSPQIRVPGKPRLVLSLPSREMDSSIRGHNNSLKHN